MRILVEDFSVKQFDEGYTIKVSISGNELPSSLQRKLAKSMVKSDTPYTNALTEISVWDNRHNIHNFDSNKIFRSVNREDLGTLDDVHLCFINNKYNEIQVDFVFVSKDNNEHMEELLPISGITEVNYYGGFDLEDEDKDLWIKDFNNVTKEEIIEVLTNVVTEFLMNI